MLNGRNGQAAPRVVPRAMVVAHFMDDVAHVRELISTLTSLRDLILEIHQLSRTAALDVTRESRTASQRLAGLLRQSTELEQHARIPDLSYQEVT